MQKETACLQVQGLEKHFGVGDQRQQVLQDISLEVHQGEILALLGASGCGKTSLLNILAGFVSPDAGSVYIQGRPSTVPGPHKAVVFQEDALFPWLTVMENVEFGLKCQGRTRKEQRDTALKMLGLVGLEGKQAMLPAQLSGGMRQRVALARVLALSPMLMLMDEPFAALDALTREEMHGLLLSLHAEFSQTIIFVTHDVIEAVTLADRVLVMGGRKVLSTVDISAPRPRKPETDQFMEDLRILRAALKQAYSE